jgi:hypothetical protein
MFSAACIIKMGVKIKKKIKMGVRGVRFEKNSVPRLGF